MINLLIGQPGGGKSYESVVHHVLPALLSGRKIITNLPLNIDAVTAVAPGSRHLIEIRTASKIEGARPFSVVEDYEDAWRDPATNRGALFIIDEAHKAIPRIAVAGGIAETQQAQQRLRAVEEWYAEHRHAGADVLLITQSYGKLSKAIVDQVQCTYRVKKATLFGNSGEYVFKVQDGVRGEVLVQTMRTYEPKYFKLYTSHTKSAAAVIESTHSQETPTYKKIKRAGTAAIVLGLVWVAVTLGTAVGEPERTKEHRKPPKAGQSASRTQTQPQPQLELQQATSELQEPPQGPERTTAQSIATGITNSDIGRAWADGEPYQGMGVHVQGRMTRASGEVVYLFAVTINAQESSTMTTGQMQRAGYVVTPVNDCTALLEYSGRSFYARCDRPKLQAVHVSG